MLHDSKPLPLSVVPNTAAVIGGGPAGLMAAEVLTDHGITVDLYDAMPSVGRKFLLAGRGGLNLTHAELPEKFLTRFGERVDDMTPILRQFSAAAVRGWAYDLGIVTFVGSSQRVFPVAMKASPLLRAWLHRLRERDVRFHLQHRWLGWGGAEDQGAQTALPHHQLPLRFSTPNGEVQATPSVVVIALGGGSWARLGSDGAWVPLLRKAGVDVTPLTSSNCGFESRWSAHFQGRFSGHPLKSIRASFVDLHGRLHEQRGEMLVTESGLEGSLIYAWSALLRKMIEAEGSARLMIDLAPDKSLERVINEVSHPRGARSLSSHLQSRVGIHGLKAGLLRERLSHEALHTPALLASAIKALPVLLCGVRSIDRAISSAGGVRFEALDKNLMLRTLPGVFCAGEMLDWEAPTGGYLLTGCFASGRMAGEGAAQWLALADLGRSATKLVG